jgi:hypothetical protein
MLGAQLFVARVSAANLVTNPCFAGGSSSGWTLDTPDYTVTSTVAYSGCGTGYSVNQSSINSYHNFATIPAMTVTPSATYTLQFWYNMSSTNPTHLQINQSTEFGTDFLDVAVTSTNQSWAETQQTFNTGSATSVVVRFYNNNGPVNAYYDDFDLDLASAFGGTVPTINSFTANPATTTLGMSSTLSWNVGTSTPTTTIVITGNSLNLTTSTTSGTIAVAPNATGTFNYVLTANNVNGTSTQNVNVGIFTPPYCSWSFGGRACAGAARTPISVGRLPAINRIFD